MGKGSNVNKTKFFCKNERIYLLKIRKNIKKEHLQWFSNLKGLVGQVEVSEEKNFFLTGNPLATGGRLQTNKIVDLNLRTIPK